MTAPALKEKLLREADAIREEDIAISRAIGRYGFGLLRRGDGILTHCNAGTLATAKYGTALAPVCTALEAGWDDLRVYCDETRPLLQGARLTAFELQSAGVDTTQICDNMASATMARGKVDNPAFDVTDHTLVTGFITEKGIAYPPFDKAFREFGF